MLKSLLVVSALLVATAVQAEVICGTHDGGYRSYDADTIVQDQNRSALLSRQGVLIATVPMADYTYCKVNQPVIVQAPPPVVYVQPPVYYYPPPVYYGGPAVVFTYRSGGYYGHGRGHWR